MENEDLCCKASKSAVTNVAATSKMNHDIQTTQSSSGLKNNFPGLLKI